MKCSVVVVLLVFSIVGLTRSANILVILPTPAFSHQSFYRTYLLGLHSRGHNLTVATPNPIQNPNMTGYREIDLNYAYAHLSEALVAAFGTSKLVRMNPEVYFLLATKVVDILCNKILADDNLMSLYRNNEKFDLLVIEWGINYCFYPFEKLSDGKLIGIASYELGSLTHMSLGNPSNPAYVPDYAMDNTDRMSFPERVRMTLFYWFMSSVVIVLRWHEYFITKKYFGPDAPDIFETNKKVSLVFENSHPSMSYPRPWNVNLIPIGGPAFHLIGRKPGELPKDIQTFMDDAEDGVIYFSLGSNVKTGQGFDAEELILIESFKRMKQRILWKWENENLKVDLKNVKISKWFPQVEILAHPKTKAFVTQGGLQSISEAIEYKVPMIVMPFFADQGHNAVKMESVGVAISLDFGTLTSDEFARAMTDIVYNSTYKENIIKFKELVNDQPMPTLEKAVWWTEYVIRHNGAPHLRSVAATMPWYKYLLLDVVLFLLIVSLIFFYIIYTVLRFAYRLMCKRRKTKKD